MQVTIQEFMDRAEELVRLAESGELVTITRDSKPVAEMSRHRPRMSEEERRIIARLVEEGKLIPPLTDGYEWNFKPIEGTGKPLSQMVIEEREESY